ncbi:MAG: AMP-binding protein, partial [Bacteroidales bacterium]|nr:AMP-binding protein [Bacteroidales bacterium]
LTRVPSPKIIIEAFAAVRPRLIIAVPLILEKIIKTKVFPLLEKPYMKLLLTVPFVNDRLLNKIKEKLNETFGGQLYEMIIGGAALNKDVEKFLRKINFPYTVGYGMTECAPLISYEGHEYNKVGACGRVVDGMEAVVESYDPQNVVGELKVRGKNVMLGYYKNPEATAEALRDGWLYTGDLCTLDSDGFIFIKGRNKNLILGPSGQNIYPEEIEQKLNNLPYVCESIVIENAKGKLIALIYPDFENLERQGIADYDILKLMKDNVAHLNKDLPAYSQLTDIKIQSEEFEKTPRRSIKRFLYQHKY